VAARCATVSALIHTAEDQCQTDTATLGDLLYADPAKTRIAEAEWIALIRSIAAGEPLALREIYDRTLLIVFTLALRIVNDREVAEEVTLDVFQDVWRGAARYDPASGSVVGWIMNQARSRAIDRRSKALDRPEQDGLLQEALVFLKPDAPGTEES
jgi:RNA polymerase sigma-70 factor, ECF subfamily